MSSDPRPVPANWANYRIDGNQASSEPRLTVTFNSDTRGQRQSVPHGARGGLLRPTQSQDGFNQDLRRRRSSLGMRVDQLRAAGGVNSIDNFARSWQRAAGFYEITPVRPSFRYVPDEHDEDEANAVNAEGVAESLAGRSLLRQQIMSGARTVSDDALDVEDLPSSGPLSSMNSQDPASREQMPLLGKRPSHTPDDNIFTIEPSLASPFGGSYGSTWGSLASRVNEPSMRHAGRLFREQQAKGITEPDKEREPLLVKQVQEEDGKVVNVIVGQSTLPQTIFNSVNVLVGVGLLALPLSMRYAGWIPGLIVLIFAALSTSYTAKVLAKCADVDSSLVTFADLAYVSFGNSARIATSVLFGIELVGACVALIVLFADSLDALLPGWGLTEWKVVCGLITLPLVFVPLRYLSFTSILGITCCFGITLAVLVDGLLKPHQPGSLREPAQTYLFPSNWATLPISFGLLMSPWGGHSVFPNIYRDMRHPYKYRRGINITYIFTFLLDLMLAVVGWLMFGDNVADEITKNIVDPSNHFPHWISVAVVVFIAIIPITKVPLTARPIVSTIEVALGLDPRALASSAALTGMSGLTRGFLMLLVRAGCMIIFVILAVLVPDFDRLMSLLGAVACFTICIILPCSFHLKLFGKELSRGQKILDWSLIVVSSILAIISTAFNFIPKDKLSI